jgi:hypothetical protein
MAHVPICAPSVDLIERLMRLAVFESRFKKIDLKQKLPA